MAEAVRLRLGAYRAEGPTPQGGAYSIALFSDQDGNPVEKAQALRVEIHEFDTDDRCIFRTYGTLEHNGVRGHW